MYRTIMPTLVYKIKNEEDKDHDSPDPITSNGYDGLNTLRSSTSMEDFTRLLENTITPSVPALTPPPITRTKPSEHIGGDGLISGQTKKRSNIECNTISDISLSHPQDLLSSNKKMAICIEKGNVNVVNPSHSSQFTNEAVLSMNTMGGGSMITSDCTTTTSSKCSPLSTPCITTLPIPPSNPEGTAMANSLQIVHVSQSGDVKNMITTLPSATIKTEESFNFPDADVNSSQHLQPVITNSAHFTSLTSNNWISPCATSINNAAPATVAPTQFAAPVASIVPETTKTGKARRPTLTNAERARQNRDRNREHARNTRLRKKAYVEQLKLTLTEMVARRDAREFETKQKEQRDSEVREVRYRVMEEFLKLRASGSDANFANLLARWTAILEGGFTLTLPKTEYRLMVENGSNTQTGVHVSAQVLRGAAECLEDASKITSFISTFVSSNNTALNSIVTMSYICDRKRFMMDGDIAMLDWSGLTSGAITQGAMSELNVQGRMKATFNPVSNKLICAELLFDTGTVPFYVNEFMHTQQVNQSTNGSSLNNLLDSVLPSVTSEVNGMSANVTITSDSSSDDHYQSISP